jgi:hypothetical protein
MLRISNTIGGQFSLRPEFELTNVGQSVGDFPEGRLHVPRVYRLLIVRDPV